MSVGRGLEGAVSASGAIRVLVVLLEESPLGATELTDRIGGYTAQGITAARPLAAAGLVSIKEIEGIAGKPAYEIELTPRGRQVAELIAKAAALVPDPSLGAAHGGLKKARPLREGRDLPKREK